MEPRPIFDLADMPDFNWDTQKDRADWSTRDVSARTVVVNPVWNKPDCVEHGAMNCVSPPRNIYRCLTCGRAAYSPVLVPAE
ncbi:hypothetical protein [Arthrobacter sp. N1]|uniref:hypothetical protein n=1 Tax=Arthrobacter sp. N1 TaxID=619291 RepID=UPI003BB0A263